MDFNKRKENEKPTKNTKILICNRESINLLGVTKVGSCTETTICLDLAGESMIIEGQGLHITKLDIETGIVDITGKVNGLKYAKGKTNGGFFKRIFS